MKSLKHDIVCKVLALLMLLLLAVAPAVAQTVVQQGKVITYGVVEEIGYTYLWEIYNDGNVNFATVPGNCPPAQASFVGSNTSSSVRIKWRRPGIFYYKVTVTDDKGCALNIKIGMVEVIEWLPTAVIVQPDPDWICEGESAELKVIFTGEAPFDFTYTDGLNKYTIKDINDNEYIIKVSPTASSSYWVTEVYNENGTNIKPSDPVLLIVNKKPESSKIYQFSTK